MKQAYFIFNNISSEDYLMVNTLPSIIKAQKDIEKIEVVGRDGFLTKDNGAYKGILKTVECTITDLDNIDYICSWLDGSSNVIFSNEPDKIYRATIINQIEFKKVAVTFHTFIIQFDCMPHKYLINNPIITLTSPGTIYNSGGAISKPVIKVFCTGDMSVTINSQVVNLTGISEYIEINSDLMDAYKGTQLCNNQMLGEFPVLEIGNNNISWVGDCSKLEIIPNFRWI